MDNGSAIGVAGAGAWGRALATAMSRAGSRCVLWSRTETPGFSGCPSIRGTTSLDELRACRTLLVAVPAQSVRDVVQHVGTDFSGDVMICAKGLEQGTAKLLSDVVLEVAPRSNQYVLSGPSFAQDVAADRPVAVALAGPTRDLASAKARQISTPRFRIYPTDDVIGVQLGGALKNVLAIACGVADGKGLGDSARAALVTRSFAELSRVAIALGARPETVAGLSGLGDLILTATSSQSRNYSLGVRLGQGLTLDEALVGLQGVSEGRFTAEAVVRLARDHKVEAPVSESVLAIVEGRSSANAEVARLLARPMKTES